MPRAGAKRRPDAAQKRLPVDTWRTSPAPELPAKRRAAAKAPGEGVGIAKRGKGAARHVDRPAFPAAADAADVALPDKQLPEWARTDAACRPAEGDAPPPPTPPLRLAQPEPAASGTAARGEEGGSPKSGGAVPKSTAPVLRLFLEEDEGDERSPPPSPRPVAARARVSRGAALLAMAKSAPPPPTKPAAPKAEEQAAGGRAAGPEGAKGRGGEAGSAVADAQAFLDSQEKFKKARDQARANTLSLAMPSRPNAKRLPVRKEDMNRRIEARIKQVQLEREEAGALDAAPAPQVQVPVVPQSEEERKLLLPIRFTRLLRQFDCLDTAIAFAKARRATEIVEFRSLQSNVQEITRRDFSLTNFRQILSVAPGAYHTEWNWRESRWTLCVSFAFETDADRDAQNKERPTASYLRRRKEGFRRALEGLVKAEHSAFVQGLEGVPQCVKDRSGELTAWHPDFRVEGVPDVAAAELPEKPNGGRKPGDYVTTLSTEELKQAAQGASASVQEALSKVIASRQEADPVKEDAAAAESEQATLKALSKPIPKALQGLSAALIEKVRRREAEAGKAGIGSKGTTGQIIKHRELVSRLPVLIEMIHTFFTHRGFHRNACPMAELCTSLTAQSCDHTVTRKDIIGQLDMLAEKLPEWCTITQVGQDRVFTIVNRLPMAQVRESVGKLKTSLGM